MLPRWHDVESHQGQRCLKTVEALQYTRLEFDYTASTFDMQWAESFVLRNKSFFSLFHLGLFILI